MRGHLTSQMAFYRIEIVLALAQNKTLSQVIASIHSSNLMLRILLILISHQGKVVECILYCLLIKLSIINSR